MVGVGILIYSGVCVFGFFVQQAWQFWVLAILVSTSPGRHSGAVAFGVRQNAAGKGTQ